MKIAVEAQWVADGTIEKAIEFARALEIDRIVLNAMAIPGFKETGKLDLATLKDHKRQVEAAKMSTSTVVYRAPRDIAEGGPGATREYDLLVKNLDAMAEAGLSVLSMFCGIRRPVDPSQEEAQWAKLVGFYQRLVSAAEERGIKIASHFSGTAPAATMLTGAAGYRKLFEAVPSANNGLCFCVGNAWVSDGERIYDVIQEFADRIFYVHMRSTRMGWGEHPFWWDDPQGPDIRRIWKLLKDNGYQGDVRAEHLPEVYGDAHSAVGTAWAIGYMKALQQYVQ